MTDSTDTDNNANNSNTPDLLALLDDLIEKAPQFTDKAAEVFDSQIRARISKLTKGMSPMQLALAYADWLGHLSLAPGKRTKLLQSLAEKVLKLSASAAKSLTNKDEETPHSSSLFKHELWSKPPFNLLAKGHQTTMDWLKELTTDVPGVESSNSELVSFINEQIFQLLAPSNLPQTNPEVLKTTWDEKGRNLLEGICNLQRDIQKSLFNKNDPEMGEFKVGENMAITPGKVIFQNDLIELIQYKSTTKTVAQEPVLIVPSWIMKYYILDLSPEKSLVKYLVDQGKTVFMISWKNPDKEDKELSLDDYLKSGFFTALDAVRAITPKTKINAVGYCIGGTLLSIGAAALAREGDEILNSITLLAAQVDFTEPGEIQRFLSGTSQMAFLDSLMWTDGYLEAASMGNAFKALRAEDMIINPAIERYYLGRKTKLNNLTAWNADGTRMPAAMHSRYLKELFMENQLSACKFMVDGKPVTVQDIRAPFFVIGTNTDHVAPWKSVYKVQQLARSEVTFLLTTGGHNAGIVCGPEHPRRKFQIMTHDPMDKYIDPDTWAATVETQQGSWWPLWNYWLNEQSIGEATTPTMGSSKKGYKVLRDAPGDYVFGQ